MLNQDGQREPHMEARTDATSLVKTWLPTYAIEAG
jgi:hypothetical protein